MKEEWRDIKDFPNYQVSNLGNVKSLNFRHTGQERKLKKLKQKSDYFYVILYKEGSGKHCLIHRLVAEAFIPNPDNLPCVNHKDENKHNNCLNNLEFCSYQYNSNYGTVKKRIADKKSSISIKCIDLETNKTTIYPSIHEAARQMNIKYNCIRDNMTKCKKPYKNKYKFIRQ